MSREYKTTIPCFFLAHNGVNVHHYGPLTPTVEAPEITITTGQPNLEIFATKVELDARLDELGVTREIE